MYILLGITLAFSALLVLNALASLLSSLVWRALSGAATRWTASTRAHMIFMLRVVPAAAAIVAVLALMLPAYILYEPRASAEEVNLKIALLSLLSALSTTLALWRWHRVRQVTRRLTDDWLRQSTPIRVAGVSVPSYRVRHAFPVVALVGTFRPRLFIAEQVLASLSDEEMRSVVAHELGHLSARDNIKRTLLRGCRDLLMFAPFGRALDRAWAESAEQAADEFAARTDDASAIDLASALVKISRMVSPGTSPAMPAGAFLLEEQLGGVAERVVRLTTLSKAISTPGQNSRRTASPLWFYPSAALVAMLFLFIDAELLIHVHTAVEHFVSILQ